MWSAACPDASLRLADARSDASGPLGGGERHRREGGAQPLQSQQHREERRQMRGHGRCSCASAHPLTARPVFCCLRPQSRSGSRSACGSGACAARCTATPNCALGRSNESPCGRWSFCRFAAGGRVAPVGPQSLASPPLPGSCWPRPKGGGAHVDYGDDRPPLLRRVR